MTFKVLRKYHGEKVPRMRASPIRYLFGFQKGILERTTINKIYRALKKIQVLFLFFHTCDEDIYEKYTAFLL
jgi:hypothetical protein